jgi:hypothetical protein
MPDFERVFRSLDLHLAKDDYEREALAREHAAQDRRRWRLALWAAITALAAILMAL